MQTEYDSLNYFHERENDGNKILSFIWKSLLVIIIIFLFFLILLYFGIISFA